MRDILSDSGGTASSWMDIRSLSLLLRQSLSSRPSQVGSRNSGKVARSAGFKGTARQALSGSQHATTDVILPESAQQPSSLRTTKLQATKVVARRTKLEELFRLAIVVARCRERLRRKQTATLLNEAHRKSFLQVSNLSKRAPNKQQNFLTFSLRNSFQEQMKLISSLARMDKLRCLSLSLSHTLSGS